MEVVSTGIDGLDAVLQGGLPRGTAVVLEGAPGTGKTTLGIQYLVSGVRGGEPGMFITFEELPEQLYAEMMAFGWDLREMEKAGSLRIASMSPALLIAQMMEPDGLFERLVREIGCRRIVVDSISLYKYSEFHSESPRQTMYKLRNVLRKFGMTSLLIREEMREDNEAPFENFVFDGVIRLRLKPYRNQFRMRTIEVLKMRGRPIREGEHMYRIGERGVHVVPARSMVEDLSVVMMNRLVPTGIAKLDEQLSGGIPRGAMMLLDTNSKANYKYIVASIFAERLNAGDHVIAMMSSMNTPRDVEKLLALHGISLGEAAAAGSLHFVEHYHRQYPPELEASIFDISGLNNEQYEEWQREKLLPAIQCGLEQGKEPFVYYDLNTVMAARGKSFIHDHFTREAAWVRSQGYSVLVLANFAEIGAQTSSFLERTCNGVIRTWVDGSYQFLQVTKSPNGRMSEPLLVENVSERPYIRLI